MTQPFVYGGSELEGLARARNYYRWLVGLFAPHLGERVLEIGAGTGTFASAILAARPAISLTLVEPASNNLPILERRFAGDARVKVVPGFFAGLGQDDAPMDSVVLVNVLEHVEDAHALLRSAREALRPGGRMILLVPVGGTMLYGTMDEAFGHHRRFTAEAVRTLLEECHCRVSYQRYLNSVGVVPWFLLGRVLRRRSLSSVAIRIYDFLAIPMLRRLENSWTPRFGQSLFVVAEAVR
ncbi:MAG: hypothetical protein JWM95_1068 [Gemmatimonadetes bacterium]|nr:hypothetical protein [Gemmatimonadota bacterium]